MKRGWLKELRGEKTQTELSEMVGIVQGFYADIENGNKRPSVSVAKKIAETLNFDWTLFFEEQKEKPAERA